MRVVVADDEIKVCQLICNLVDWHSFDMEIVGIAHNGIEALELIETCKPDLVVTDIRMPGCDGLEMISQAKRIREELDFIIISGHRHFEYAQRAIRYGVYDYLLKPIKKDELCDTLQKMRDKYRERIQRLSLEEQQKISMQNDIERLRSGMFSELLLQGAPKDEITLETLRCDYHFNFAPGFFQVFIVKLDFPFEAYYQDTANVFLIDKVTQKLQGLLKPECFDMQVSVIGSRAYGILNYAKDAHAPRRKLKAALDELLVQASVFENICLTIGVGEPVEKASLLGRSLSSAEAAVGLRLVEGTGTLIEGVTPAEPVDTTSLLSDFRRKMDMAVETLNEKLLSEMLELFYEQCRALPSLNAQTLIPLIQGSYRTCLASFGNHYRKVDDAEKRLDHFDKRTDLCGSVGALFVLLADELSEIFSETLEKLRQADAKPVRAAKQYIQENYFKPITLEELSSIAGFNPSYFSTLFKKESGQNFSEYLTQVRMNRAKELLKETHMTVAAICSEVGYSDLKHFSQSFKKHTGLKPNEFRKLFS